MDFTLLYPTLKTLHLIFVISWFAALFYLPRLFVYHADTHDSLGYQRFLWMESRLIKLSRIAELGTLVFGSLLAAWYWWGSDTALSWPLWLWLKVALVLVLMGYQEFLVHAYNQFHAHKNRYTSKTWRWLNEIPAVLLIALVLLVVFKPSW